MVTRRTAALIATILISSICLVGADPEPIVFTSGRDGALNIMLLAGPFPKPLPAVEAPTARKVMPSQGATVHTTRQTWNFAYKKAKPIDCSEVRGAKRYYYACCELVVLKKSETHLFINGSNPLQAWLHDSPMVPSRRNSRIHSLHLPMPKEPGTYRLWLRLDADQPAAAFYAFAGAIEEGRLAPTDAVRVKLNLQDFAEKQRPAIVQDAIMFGSSPRFIDNEDKIRFRMEPQGEYLPLMEGKVKLTIAGEHAWLTGTSRIKDMTTFLDEGISVGLTIPKEKTTWLTTEVTGKLWLGDTLLAEMTAPIFCEDNLKTTVEKLKPEAEKETSGIAKLSLEQIDMLTENRINRTLFYGSMLASRIELATKALKSNGKDILAEATGFVEAAYVSRADGSAQPYKYYMPPKAYAMRQTRPIPMILMLHGYVPSYNKLNWMGIDKSIGAAMDALGWCYVLPFGRGNTDFLTIGEVDVLRVIEEMKRRYPIDHQRIYLAGYSMGGSGVWTMLSHYPDIFAAAQIWSGRTDYYFWHNEDYQRAGVTRSTIPAWKRTLIDADNPYHLFETLQSIPVRTVHPLDDSLIKPGHSIRIYELLQPPNGRMILEKPIQGSHWYYAEEIGVASSYQWMNKHALTAPKTVEHVTFTPKYGNKHWVSIQGITTWGKRAHIRVTADRATNRFIIHNLENISSLRFDCSDFGEKAAAKTWCVVLKNGESELARGKNGQLWWPGLPKPGTKTPAICGPVKEAFNTRFILVTGEDLSALENARLFREDWLTFAHADAPRIPAAKITDRHVAECNLVCFGSPSKNSFVKKIADRLPFKFYNDGYGVGTKRVKGAGFVGVYPNPLNPKRLVVVIDGLYYGKGLSFNHKWDLVPDYIVFDHNTDQYDSTNTAVLGGFFDSNWQVTNE